MKNSIFRRIIWFSNIQVKEVLIVIVLISIAQVMNGQSINGFKEWLNQNRCAISFRLNQYDYSHYNRLTSSWKAEGNRKEMVAPGVKFGIDYALNDSGDDFRDLSVTFQCLEGSIDQSSLSVDLDFSDWSAKNFVLMPGVVYDGNKPFNVWKSPHWYPFITDPRYLGPEKEPYVTDIPRLSPDGGVSRIQMRSGHMTTPSIGFQSPSQRRGFWLLTDQETRLGDNGIDIEENRSRTGATITITAPVVREVYRYRHMTTQYPSSDPSASFKKGDKLTLRFRLYFFDAPEIQSIYDKFTEIRKVLPANREFSTTYPFSNTFDILEKKYNLENWDDEIGFYKLRIDYKPLTWQIGWMGGAISTYPMMLDGSKLSQERIVRMMDWLFKNGISPSGYFWDTSEDGKKFTGIYPHIPVGDTVLLVRGSGDGLLYLCKQFSVMKQLNIPVKPEWEKKLRGVADAFVRTWKKFGQPGQYVSQCTGDVVVGKSASGAIVPKALLEAAKYFGDHSYIEIAGQMGDYFYRNFTRKGITYGGPGDALQNPDCESSYALVESYLQLYESTKDEKWLKYSVDAANQFTSWVLSYNYKFPSSSYYGKLQIKPIGAVFANPQNGTGTPAICTHSGLGLLKLYRSTGNILYLNLLQDIAHNIPQYLSHPDKMINPKHEGWMCERVVTADWLQDIGEIAYLSTWPEVAMMLTYAEIPGLYLDTSKGLLAIFDNVEARIVNNSEKNIQIEISNPTHQHAKIKVLLDNEKRKNESIEGWMNKPDLVIELNPAEKRVISLKK